ncbi:MAG: PilZ domain-containing protein [Thermodesulfobacteriota bacterium]
MGEKRKSRRLPFRKRIRLGKENPTFMGYAVNISEQGLEVEARNVFPAGTRIVISLQEEGESGKDIEEIRVEGIVRWSTRLAGSLSGKMGVEIIDDSGDTVKSAYRERINKLIKE